MCFRGACAPHGTVILRKLGDAAPVRYHQCATFSEFVTQPTPRLATCEAIGDSLDRRCPDLAPTCAMLLATIPFGSAASLMCTSAANVSASGARSACAHAAANYRTYAGSGLEEFAAKLRRLAHASGAASSGSTARRIKILVMGNSVARWNKFLASHVFRRMLHAAFPTINFEVNTGSVEGGFGPSHQLYCGRGEWKDTAVVLVHFAELSGGAEGTSHGRDLLEQLMSLPQRPLVIVIKHCALAQLEMLMSGGVPNSSAAIQRSVWFRRDKHHTRMQRDAEGMQQAFNYVSHQARFERGDSLLARSMNATLVDSCDLLRSMLPASGPSGAGSSGACARGGTGGGGGGGGGGSASSGGSEATEGRGQSLFELLATRMFPYNAKQGLGDPLHPTPEYSELQGCAAARLVLAARHMSNSSLLGGQGGSSSSSSSSVVLKQRQQQQQHEPQAQTQQPHLLRFMRTDHGGAAAATAKPRVTEPWCLRVGDAPFESAMMANAGWAVQTGGAGGSKRWLQARSVGAFLQLRLRITTHRLTLEYYKHDTLPMGMVQATLSIDAKANASVPSGPRAGTSNGGPLSLVHFLDGKCAPADHCPKGQGFYHRAILAEGLDGSVAAPVLGTLRLSMIPRDDGTNGTEFSLVTVVSEN